MPLDQLDRVADTGCDLQAGLGVRDGAVAQAVGEGRRMEAGADDGAGMSVGADAVRDHVEHVAPIEVRRRPDVGLDAHGRAVAAGVRPAREGVGVPQRGRLPEVPGRGLGGPPAAQRVREPDRQLDTAERLRIEAVRADRPADRHPQLSVVGPAAGRKKHVDAPPAAGPPLPIHEVVQGSALRPPLQSLAIHKFADEAESVPVGRPHHRSPRPHRSLIAGVALAARRDASSHLR